MKQYVALVEDEVSQSMFGNSSIKKYFRIEKDELLETIGEIDIFKEFEHGEDLLPIGDGIWLRYERNKNLPDGVLVQNPEINISYKGAGAGMRISDIEKKLSSVMDNSEADYYIQFQYKDDTCYYIQFQDKDYTYYFISIDGREEPTVLYITS